MSNKLVLSWISWFLRLLQVISQNLPNLLQPVLIGFPVHLPGSLQDLFWYLSLNLV